MRVSIRPLLTILLALHAAAGTCAESDAEFERFFTDKRTRMQLNQAREQHSFISPGGITPAGDTQELVLPDIKFNGMIIRQDGSTQVWVSGGGSAQGDEIGEKVERNVRRTKNNRVLMTLPSGETVSLKPGQVYSMETERIREAYEGAESPTIETEAKSAAPETREGTENAQAEDKPEAELDEAALDEDPDGKIGPLEERLEMLEQAQPEN